eukprot:6767836-Alexandrium_andersonii.AAC.1
MRVHGSARSGQTLQLPPAPAWGSRAPVTAHPPMSRVRLVRTRMGDCRSRGEAAVRISGTAV